MRARARPASARAWPSSEPADCTRLRSSAQKTECTIGFRRPSSIFPALDHIFSGLRAKFKFSTFARRQENMWYQATFDLEGRLNPVPYRDSTAEQRIRVLNAFSWSCQARALAGRARARIQSDLRIQIMHA